MNRLMKRMLASTLACSVLLGTVSGFGSVSAADDALVFDRMEVNNMPEPFGIDTANPVFSWTLQSTVNAQRQTAYQVVVSTTKEKAAAGNGDMWDSGKVAGDRNLEVRYAGKALESKTAYYWAVKVWDAMGRETAWSPIKQFETAFLKQSDWKAKWIGAPEVKDDFTADFSGCKWIWGSFTDSAKIPAETVYLRKSFTIGKAVKKAYLLATCDNNLLAKVNGEAVADSSNWEKAAFVDITAFIQQGPNELAVQAKNADTTYAGFVAKCILLYEDGSSEQLVSDHSWKYTRSADGWETADTASWENAQIVGDYGISPWNGACQIPQITVGDNASTPYFRKDFTVEKTVKSARAYVTGLGYYVLTLNGQKVGDHILDPGHTDYDQTVLYATYDITSQLLDGANAVGIELGNGFYHMKENTPWSWNGASWKSPPKALVQLEITYDDGSVKTVVSDESWKMNRDGPTVYNSVYFGEIYDATKEIPGWDEKNFDDEGWTAAPLVDAPKGTLTAQTLEPIRTIATAKPVGVNQPKSGVYVVESDVVTAGNAIFKGRAPKGTRVTLTYGERLNSDGTVSTFTLNEAGTRGQSDTYIFKGEGEETFEPKFSYKGYKYLMIEGYPSEITAENVTFLTQHSDIETTGTFVSSNAMINQIHDNMVRTLLNNYHSKPTDTPTYEKNGWLGDANMALENSFYNFDMNLFYQKWIGDIRDSMQADGLVPQIAPSADWGYGFSAVWTTAYVDAVYELSRYTGETRLAQAHYESLLTYANRLETEVKRTGSNKRAWLADEKEMGDWCSPGADTGAWGAGEGCTSTEGSGVTSSLYLYEAFMHLADLAEQMEDTANVERFTQIAEKIKNAVNEAFLREGDYYQTDVWTEGSKRNRYRQTDNVLPLAMGIVPADRELGVVKRLVEEIKKNGYHLDTGMVGTKYLFRVLTDYGYGEVAYKIATNKTYPGYGYWIDQLGATSMWETWEPTARSNNHYFLGTVDEWFYRDLAGIDEVEDGYAHFTIQPNLFGDLTDVEATQQTPKGALSVHTQRGADGYRLTATVPVGAQATVKVPYSKGVAILGADGKDAALQTGAAFTGIEDGKAVYLVASGSYTFQYGGTDGSMTISEAQKTVQSGETFTLTAGFAQGTEPQTIVWRSEDESIAQVDDKGQVTAVGEGSTFIYAASADGKLEAFCRVTVLPKPVSVSGISLDQTALTLQEGKNAALKATIAPADATNQEVLWRSSDPDIVTVSNGQLTAKKAGTAVILAVSAEGGYTAACTVTVAAAQKPVPPVKDGWIRENGKWYLYEAGVQLKGWQPDGNKRYYLDPESGAMRTGWYQVEGKWYFSESTGAMATGWKKLGKWYYFGADGAMRTGWYQVGNKWYFSDNSGAMATGWKKLGKWYYFGADGAMRTGWYKVGNKWYFSESTGAMATGWKKLGKWYYFGTDGSMKTGWKKIGAKWYYFESSGKMLASVSRRIGNVTYRFDTSGACLNP